MKKALLLLLFLSIGAIAFADMTYVSKVHSGAVMGQPAKDMTLTSMIKGKKFKTEIGEGNWMLIDLDQGKMFMVDNTKKTVIVGTLDEMKKMGSMMMGGQNVKASVQKTGKTETVSGVACDDYTLTTTGQGFMTMNGTFTSKFVSDKCGDIK